MLIQQSLTHHKYSLRISGFGSVIVACLSSSCGGVVSEGSTSLGNVKELSWTFWRQDTWCSLVHWQICYQHIESTLWTYLWAAFNSDLTIESFCCELVSQEPSAVLCVLVTNCMHASGAERLFLGTCKHVWMSSMWDWLSGPRVMSKGGEKMLRLFLV